MLLALTFALIFVLMILLPSIIEAKKPRDKGPRRILRSSLHESVEKRPKLVPIKRDDIPDSGRSKDLEALLRKSGVRYQRFGKNAIRILQDITFQNGFEARDNLVVEGCFEAGARCVFHGSIKSRGNATLGDYTVVEGNLISLRNVYIGDEVVIGGSVHSEGSVRVGENVFVGLPIVAIGDVEIYQNSEVNNNIITRGVIRVRRHPRVDLPPSLDDIG